MTATRSFLLALAAVALLLAVGCEKDTQPAAPDSDNSGSDPEAVLRQFQANQAEAGTPAGALMPADLSSRIADAIRLLQAKDYPALTKEFTPPDVLKAKRGAQTEDAINNEMRDKAGQLLPKLQEAATLRPAISVDGGTATFPNGVKFTRIAGVWYLAD